MPQMTVEVNIPPLNLVPAGYNNHTPVAPAPRYGAAAFWGAAGTIALVSIIAFVILFIACLIAFSPIYKTVTGKDEVKTEQPAPKPKVVVKNHYYSLPTPVETSEKKQDINIDIKVDNPPQSQVTPPPVIVLPDKKEEKSEPVKDKCKVIEEDRQKQDGDKILINR